MTAVEDETASAMDPHAMLTSARLTLARLRHKTGRSALARTTLALGLAAAVLAGCQETPKHLKPLSPKLRAQIERLGMTETAPVYVRVFKEESKLEVWKQRADGRYGMLKTYDICKWSGALGPKIREGDRQAPEGFYTVTPAQMNPNSSYHLAFNIGYPNAFDRSLGRTGSNLMVHGACSSAGCYSMNDEQVQEIFSLARDAFRGGQRSFQVAAFPFRMTPENLARHRDSPHMPFWLMLKNGYDHFEVTRQVPKVDVCGQQYVFNADAGGLGFNPTAACPAYQVPGGIAAAVASKQSADDMAFRVAVARIEGTSPAAVPAIMTANAPDAAPASFAPAGPAPLTTASTVPAPEPRPVPDGIAAAQQPYVAPQQAYAPPADDKPLRRLIDRFWN